jgi:hypothetical protein
MLTNSICINCHLHSAPSIQSPVWNNQALQLRQPAYPLQPGAGLHCPAGARGFCPAHAGTQSALVARPLLVSRLTAAFHKARHLLARAS